MAASADLGRDTEKPREVREGANFTGRWWTGLRPPSPMAIHPDGWNTGSPRPGYVKLDGVPDEYRLLGSNPGEAQRLTENCRIGLCHAEFFRDQDEVNETIDSEELEFCPLHLRWSVCDDANRTSRQGFIT